MIHTEEEYEKKLARIEIIFDAEKGTPKGDEMEALCTEVEEYEAEHYPIPEPTKEAIEEFIKDQREGHKDETGS